jgi:hypothetical protein
MAMASGKPPSIIAITLIAVFLIKVWLSNDVSRFGKVKAHGGDLFGIFGWAKVPEKSS